MVGQLPERASGLGYMTDAELTLLSLVSEGARYGHEIQQMIDVRGLREWLTIGFSSIYYILNKLERQNLIKSEIRVGGAIPAQRVYHITDAGQGVLQTAISDLLRQPRPLGSGFELGLANLHVLKPRQAHKVLTHHRTDLEKRLESVRTSWTKHLKDEGDDDFTHINALYTHSIALMEAELAWMQTFITNWKKKHPGVDDPRSTDTQEATKTEPHEAKTRLHRHTTPDRAKMIQRLRRPKPEESPVDSPQDPPETGESE